MSYLKTPPKSSFSKSHTQNFCLLLRGRPCSGKTTLVDNVKEISFLIVDPDLIDTSSIEFKKFVPRMNKNPNENVKKYCYLFNQAEKAIRAKRNVVWMQPWSRLAEIELTIRNFGFYHTDLKEKVWEEDIDSVVKRLPFIFAVCEIDVEASVAEKRYLKRNRNNLEIERLRKTNKFFQSYSLPTKYLKLDGNKDMKVLANKFTNFAKSLPHPLINPHSQ